MIRKAVPEDIEALDAFLRPHTDSSMFLRSNLTSQGVGWTNHPHSTRFFLWITRDGIRGVFGLTKAGFLLVQTPNAPEKVYWGFAETISGETVQGVIGPSGQVRATLSALGYQDGAYALNHEEPLCRLSLDQLPAFNAVIRRPSPGDSELLTRWFGHYGEDTDLRTAPEDAQTRAKRAAAAESTVRLLCENYRPVAMAAINAHVDGHVQVGGVFVPREHRGKGLGQRVTAALLTEAHKNGAHTAVLSSNNAYSTRAYEAVGFQRIGTVRIALLAKPRRIGMSA